MSVTHTREETQALMDETVAKLITVTALMDHYKLGGTQPRGLFDALDAYNKRLIDEAPKGWDRTHDSTSAINDEATPLPRGEGADAPQSELSDGAMGLTYTEQNFNELAAANTAMQTEISSLNQRIADKDARIADLQMHEKRYDDALGKEEARSNGLAADYKSLKNQLDEERTAHSYTRALLATEQRRTERAKGYIDRVLDGESDYGPKTEAVPIPASPIGPRLDGIRDPVMTRERSSTEDIWLQASAGEARYHNPRERQRTY
jgi:hypothetical protein